MTSPAASVRFRRAVSIPAGLVVLAVAVLASAPQGQPPQPASPPTQQPSEVSATITSGEPGAAPRFAVPDFIALSPDAETAAVAKTIGEVLWDDLNFEREFALIPRDTYSTIPRATSFSDVPFARWRELNADGVVIGTVQKTGTIVRVEARLFDVRSRQSVFGREYSGSAANPRLYAHTVADELHQAQRGLRGVARTKLTFDSDRDGERIADAVQSRGVKEIYISDYDGENQRRVTIARNLNITPAWSPDGRSIAYTSYRFGPPDIVIQNLYQALPPERLTKGTGNNFLPAWSPDGTRVCFNSTRDGNPELYIANRDGSNVRRLTNHPSIDTSPTWSPSGTQIAFTSDRNGTPQIYTIGADGLGLHKVTSESYADRPTWSPAPYNEIAFAARTGVGFDIKVIDLASGQVRQLTFGEGTNESPAYAPNGRHLAFMSTRGAGRSQIYTIARDGRNLKQITRAGNNQQPDWSR
jgi:TolB protein